MKENGDQSVQECSSYKQMLHQELTPEISLNSLAGQYHPNTLKLHAIARKMVVKDTPSDPNKANDTGSEGSVYFGTGSSTMGQFQIHLLKNY